MFVPVTAGNPTHRSYPKTLEKVELYWREYIDTIRQEAHLICRNRSLFEDFKQNLDGYITSTRNSNNNITGIYFVESNVHI